MELQPPDTERKNPLLQIRTPGAEEGTPELHPTPTEANDAAPASGLNPGARKIHFLDAPLFVWSCWLFLIVMAVRFVVQNGGNIPYWDEYELVLVYTHDRPITLAFLWEQHNEHRIPLSKLIQIGLIEISGADFKAGMIFNVILMSLTAAWLLLVARRIRGRTSYSDAFIPLVLLGLGHYENFLWNFQVAFTVSTLLTCVLLSSLVGRGRVAVLRADRLASGPAVLMGSGLVLLPLCGAQGLLVAAPLALWLGFCGLRAWIASGRRDWKAAAVVGFAVLTCLLVGGYLIGYTSPQHHRPYPDLKTWLDTSLNFLLSGFGPATDAYQFLGTVILALVVVVVLCVLVVAWIKRPEEWLGIVGLLFFLGGTLALALALGKGRAFLGAMTGFSSRYALLSVPFILALYLAVGRWGLPHTARFVQFCLLLFAVLIAPGNYQEGRAYGDRRRERYQAVEAAIQSGASPEAIAEQYGYLFYPESDEFLVGLRAMQRCRIGPYRSVPPDPEGH